MISIILVLVVAVIATTSIKSNTTYGLFQSTVLGLLCVVPFLLGLIVDALQFGVSLLFRLAFALGNSSTQEIMHSHMMRRIQDELGRGIKVKVRTEESLDKSTNSRYTEVPGDESSNNDSDDTKLQ